MSVMSLETYLRLNDRTEDAAGIWVCGAVVPSTQLPCRRELPTFLFSQVTGREEFSGLDWACYCCVSHADRILVAAAERIDAALDASPAEEPTEFETDLLALLEATEWIGDPIYVGLAPSGDVQQAQAWRLAVKAMLDTGAEDEPAALALAEASKPTKPDGWPIS